MTHSTRHQQIVGQLNSVALPAAMNLLNFRIAHYDRGADPARPEYDEHVIFAFWHEFITIVLPHWRRTPLTILVSQHRDGEWVNQTAENFGVNIVRGSTSRGGSSAIRQLKKHSAYSSIAISPDGPRGPRREMAMGPIFLASLLGMPIVPVGLAIDRAWRLNTWDKFAIPKPFARARMIFGPKIRIPRKCTREQLETRRQSVQRLINQLCNTCEDWAQSGKKMEGEQPFVRARRCRKLYFPKPETPILRIADSTQSWDVAKSGPILALNKAKIV